MTPSPRTSCEEPSLPERLQYDIFERPLGVRAHVADVVTAAEMLERLGMCVRRLHVCRREAGRDLHFAQLARLRVDEADEAVDPWIAIAFGRDLHREDVVPQRPEDLQTVLESARIEEVGDDDHEPELPRSRGECLARLTQIGRTRRLELFQRFEDAEDLPLAASRRRLVAEAAPERH